MAELIRPGDRLLIVAPTLDPEDRIQLDQAIAWMFPGITWQVIDGDVSGGELRIVGHYRPDPYVKCTCEMHETTPNPDAPRTWVRGRANPACPLHGDQR